MKTTINSTDRIELSEKIRCELIKVLNEIHDAEFSSRFWTLIVEEHIRACMTRKKLLETDALKPTADLYPINGSEFPARKEKFLNGLKLAVKHLNTRANRGKINSVLKNKNEINIGFSGNLNLKREKLGVGLFTFHPIFIGTGDKNKRRKVNQIAERYNDTYLKNITRSLPKIYVEHFQKLYDSIELVRAEKKVFHVHTHVQNSDIIFNRVLIAKYIEHGSKLIWYQYGSGIGEIEAEYGHYLEHILADEYRTWGWKMKEKDRPWKAYTLEKFRHEYENMQSSADKEFDVLFCYPKWSSRYKKAAKDTTHYLLKHLNPDKFSRILARPRPQHKKHSQASQLSFIKDDRVTLSSGLKPSAEDVLSCKLILQLNVPCTNFLECIYVDHPVTGLLRNDHPTNIVKPYYDFFKQKGVLHEDVESMVRHLNNIDIDEWWSDIVKEPMYQSFKETFTRKIA